MLLRGFREDSLQVVRRRVVRDVEAGVEDQPALLDVAGGVTNYSAGA